MNAFNVSRRELLAAVQAGTISPEHAIRLLTALPQDATLSFLQPEWVDQPPAGGPDMAGHWLVFDRSAGLRDAMASRLGAAPLLVRPAGAAGDAAAPARMLDPADPESVRALVASLPPGELRIVHLWAFDAADPQAGIRLGFVPVLLLLRALAQLRPAQRARLILLHPRDSPALPGLAAVDGLASATWLENPLHRCTRIELAGAPERFVDALLAEPDGPAGVVRLTDHGRQRRRLTRTDAPAGAGPVILPEQPVVLVTGGIGGIGRLLAGHLAGRAARLVLAGRRALPDDAASWIAGLQSGGATVEYRRADIADPAGADALCAAIRRRYGRIDAVLHAAGLAAAPSPLAELPPGEITSVFAPKLLGALHLDAATRDDSLALFAATGSMSAHALGEGIAVYAAANAGLDGFAAWRTRLVRSGARSGHSLTIDLPYCAEGGLRLDEAALASLCRQAGVYPLPSSLLVECWERMLAEGAVQCLPVLAETAKLDAYLRRLGHIPAGDPCAPVLPPQPAAAGPDIPARLDAWLAGTLGGLLALDPGLIDRRAHFAEYGVNSIIIGQFGRALQQALGPLARSLPLDHPSIGALRDALLAGHATALARHFAATAETARPAPALAPPTLANPAVAAAAPSPGEFAIAVVGLAGRYPGADTPARLWEAMRAGQRAISRLPAGRWPAGNPARPPGRATGGFLAGVDMFDPLAFRITPAEARQMHPEERLLLECAWEAIEDAGHAHLSLAGRSVGVFIGVNGLGYRLLGMPRWQAQADVSLDASLFSLPNRISHAFDLRGPSIPFDTGCSSALVALDAACRAIADGRCTEALVGGVNLYLHPSRFTLLSQAGLAASEEAPLLFAQGGDGFIPGEGAGVALLKDLAQAEADGDHVYGVIRASAVSHKGRSAGFLLPAPDGQQLLIARTLVAAGVSPADIGYVELQGLGAELTDLAEWQALTRLFPAGGPRCLAGSVKPHIGHLEAASGLAQLTRVLLQLDRDEILPCLAAPRLHDGIDLANSAFALPDRPVAWPARGTVPRALLGSVAAGGTQAFAVVEQAARRRAPAEPGARLIVLSAPGRAQLDALALALAEAIAAPGPAPSLPDLAWTLQVGRHGFAERRALLVEDTTMLQAALRQPSAGLPAGRSWSGRVEPAAPGLDEAAYGGRDLAAAAECWVRGGAVDWARLSGSARRRVSLPVYRFVRRRCWLYDEPAEPAAADHVVARYYDRFAASVPADQDICLLFAPFAEPVPGFSWLRTFFEPERLAAHHRLMTAAQAEMKTVLYRLVDFARVKRVMDIGCGLGTDLISLARAHPQLEACGFTIAPAQANSARQRVADAGLASRISISCADSAKTPFPGCFELMIGFEVLFHIADKDAVFANMAAHLAPGGQVVLADGVADTVTEIHLPELGQFTSTAQQFADALARHGLRVVVCVDASREIGNFLDDPELERNLQELRALHPGVAAAEAEHRGWARFGKALHAGLLRYLLFTLDQAPAHQAAGLGGQNLARIMDAEPYRAALDRAALGRAALGRDGVAAPATGADALTGQVVALAAQVFEMGPHELDPDLPLRDFGVDSLGALRLTEALNRALDLRLKIQDIFRYPSLRALAGHAAACGATALRPARPAPVAASTQDIAVIGMSGRFAGAPDLRTLWDNLAGGVDSVGPVPDGRFEAPFEGPLAAGEAPQAGFITGVDRFDAAFFNISPAEAEVMDPQQRIFLEQCWKALEDAGYAGPSLHGRRCGVFAGVAGNEYQTLLFGRHAPDQLSQAMLGNSAAILAARIAYFMDLRGPALTLDTACASSLAAIHYACRALQAGEAEMMLAGGVALYLTPAAFAVMGHAGMLSATQRCRPFSDTADGIAVGEGAGVVVLKPLARALADGDHIHGVIKGSATNQNGRTNGITAPSLEAQKELALSVYAASGIDPDTLSYVEAHGTGTRLGDPIELAALAEAFRRSTKRRQFCAIGSVKGNLGHTSAASGVAGLLKLLLAMRHRQIPPSLHASAENRHFSFPTSPFFLARTLQPWRPAAGAQLRAAISSFGFSGANCHMVVEAAPARPAAPEVPHPVIVPVSAADAGQLHALLARLGEALGDGVADAPALADIAFTLQQGRRDMPSRLAVIAGTRAALGAAWRDALTAGCVNVVLCPDASASEALRAAARAWAEGGPASWPLPDAAKRVSLPTVPFAGPRHWIGPAPQAATPALLYVPVWAQAPCDRAARPPLRLALLNADASLAAAFARSDRCQLLPDAAAADSLVVCPAGEQPVMAAVRTLQGIVHEIRGGLPTQVPRVLFLLQEGDPAHAALAGFGPSLRQAGATVAVGTLELESGLPADDLAALVLDHLADPPTPCVEARIRDRQRQLRRFQRLAPPPYTLPQRRTWLITGGAGGLGRLFAARLARIGQVILTGRSAPEQVDLAGLPGAAVRYLQADVADAAAMREVVGRITGEFGALHCVLHLAGSADAALFAHKDPAAFAAVLRTKLEGARVLDAVTAGTGLELFVLFSSAAAVLGDFGQCDYAVANRALDGFAAWRAGLVRAGQRQGRTLAIGWPLWRDGGMHLAAGSEALYLASSGQTALDAQSGFAAFRHALAADASQVLVLSGDPARMDALLAPAAPQSRPPADAPGVLAVLRRLCAELLKLAEAELPVDRNFGECGLDSIGLRQLAERVGARFGIQLATAELYAHPTLTALSRHLAARLPPEADAATAPTPLVAPAPVPPPPSAAALPGQAEPVAIIGLHGRFPGAADPAQFWRLIESGGTAIAPATRERCALVPDLARFAAGYLEDVDAFDAGLFQLSPREAAAMDPQQRLLLESVWAMFEDAGLARPAWSGSRTGVFVGADKLDYAALAGGAVDTHAASGLHPAMLANRVSYVFDLQGPSETVNTGCSSAAVALHRAVLAVRRGECAMAIAAGVNVILSPAGFAGAEALGGLSPTALPLPFDARADGSARGECVGAVLLKPLDQAVRDGDRIQAVILGTAAGHGGRGQSLTAPNPAAQAAIMEQALRQAGVLPADIAFIEAQGAAQPLTDALEVTAYHRVFDRLGGAVTSGCALSCLKGSIGHTEGASGIAALIKVVLALRHGVVPGVPRFGSPHPELRLDPGRFDIRAEAHPFPPGPRRAALHAFGFGGVCAHAVLAAWQTADAPAVSGRERLIAVSARGPTELATMCAALLAALQAEPDMDLGDLSYTLLTGRTQLPCRAAFVAGSNDALAAALEQWLATPDRPAEPMTANSLLALFDGDTGEAMLRLLAREGALGKLASLWEAGARFDAAGLFSGERRRRLALPTYPFRRDRHWLSGAPAAQDASAPAAPPAGAASLQPVTGALRQMLAEILQQDAAELGEDTEFAVFGVDSFLSATFMRAVQRRWGGGIALSAPLSHPTLRRLGAYVAHTAGHLQLAAPGAPRRDTEPDWPELLAINPGGSQLASFWFHGAPGLATLYGRLSLALGPDYPLYALQARGVNGRDTPFTALAPMIAHYCDIIRATQPDGPYLLGGYSFGGVLAFEAARRLSAEGAEISQVVMFDTYPPGMIARLGLDEASENRRALHRMMNAMMFFSAELDTPVWTHVPLDTLRAIPPAGQFAYLAGLIKEKVRTGLSLDEVYAFLNGVDTVTQLADAMLRAYRPAPYTASDVLYFKTARFIAEDSPFAIPGLTPEQVGLSSETLRALGAEDYTAEWRRLVRGRFRQVECDCDHLSLLVPPAVSEVADALRALLQRSGAARPQPRQARSVTNPGFVINEGERV